MGACCSKENMVGKNMEEEKEEEDEQLETREGDMGARVRVKGSCSMASMDTQQGRKGVNQDAMTIWENFTGEPDKLFCGVFDGHGPYGHIVAAYIRDVLPSKISSELKSSEHDKDGDDHNPESSPDTYDPAISSWANSFIKSFEELDKELSLDPTIDSYCSGSTAVTILRQDEHLMLANVGDSRAVICTRNKNNKLVPVQLTVDLKPDDPIEAERIRSCDGRIFAMAEESTVPRLWLPNENSPGLAMSRAFGDFCLKDHGLIATPKIYYRKLNNKDEFVVLATDGVWDVLSNKEVIRVVSSARKQSMAARLLVEHAIQAWKRDYPSSKIDDCAAICLFLKSPSSRAKPTQSLKGYPGSNGVETVASNGNHATQEASKDEWSALEGVSRVNTVIKLPRFCMDPTPHMA